MSEAIHCKSPFGRSPISAQSDLAAALTDFIKFTSDPWLYKVIKVWLPLSCDADLAAANRWSPLAHQHSSHGPQ